MHESGRVITVHDDSVDVRMEISASCGGCTACSQGAGGETVMLGVMNALGAKLGDTVDVLIPDEVRGRAAAAVFVAPVAALLAGYLAGFLLGPAVGIDGDLAGFAVGAALAVGAIVGIRGAERRLARNEKFKPRVNAILARGHGQS